MTIFAYLFALILIAAGIYHFVNPTFYFPFMPEWFPKPLANAAGGLVEILIGVALFTPSLRIYGLWAACGLMVIFLPLHVMDLLRARPLMGSKLAAIIRLLIQFILIAWLWWEASGGYEK